MRSSLRAKAIAICDEKILKKGESVSLSFYAFFANKNNDPDLLMAMHILTRLSGFYVLCYISVSLLINMVYLCLS